MLAGGAVLLLWYLGRRKQAADAALVAAEKAAGPGPLLLPLTATQNKSAKGGATTATTSTATTASGAYLTASEYKSLINPKTGAWDNNRIQEMINGMLAPYRETPGLPGPKTLNKPQ